MKKIKVRFHYKYCRIALFQNLICFVLSVLCFFEPKLLPLFVFSIIDMILTIIPAYFITIEDLESKK